MSESTKKSSPRTNKKFNHLAVKRLAVKYGLTEYYIRQSIKGDRNSETSDKIRKEYKTLCIKLDKVMKDA